MTLVGGITSTSIDTSSAESHDLLNNNIIVNDFKFLNEKQQRRPSSENSFKKSGIKPIVTCFLPSAAVYGHRLQNREKEQLCGRASSQNSDRLGLSQIINSNFCPKVPNLSDSLLASPSPDKKTDRTSSHARMFGGGGGIITTESSPQLPISPVVAKSTSTAGGGSVRLLHPLSPPVISSSDATFMSPFDFLKKFRDSRQASNRTSCSTIGKKTFSGGSVRQVLPADAMMDNNNNTISFSTNSSLPSQKTLGSGSAVYCSGGICQSQRTTDSVDGNERKASSEHAAFRHSDIPVNGDESNSDGMLRRESGSSIARSLASFFTRALSRNARDADAGSSAGKKCDRRYSRPIRISEFISRVHDFDTDTASVVLSKEFDCLQGIGREKPCTAALMSYNVPKNRFANILPYDHSRVLLQPALPSLPAFPGSDYINASYIPGYHSRREFIATQGILTSTRNDFWRMVWQQDVRVIIMLTKCVEAEQEKCNHYWPHDKRPMLSGDLQIVQVKESHENNSWTVREFTVSKDDESRTVHHWHFGGWPDFGLPENPQKLLHFLEVFRQHHPSSDMARYGPIVCHCSAGVGRTGTFIAVDRVLEQLKYAEREHHAKSVTDTHQRPHTSASVTYPTNKALDTGEVLLDIYGDISIDIFGIVCDMRRERCTMVQTDQQYLFIYQCVAKVLERRCGIDKSSSNRSSRDGSAQSAQFRDAGRQQFGLYAGGITAENYTDRFSVKVPSTAAGSVTASLLTAPFEVGNNSRQRATSGATSSQGFYPAESPSIHSRHRFSSGGN